MKLSDIVKVPAHTATSEPITVDAVFRAMAMFPKYPEPMVVVTPSLEELRAYCELAPGHAAAFAGVPVIVSRFTDRPRIVPRAWVRSHHGG